MDKNLAEGEDWKVLNVMPTLDVFRKGEKLYVIPNFLEFGRLKPSFFYVFLSLPLITITMSCS